ncbi:hypothetical protein DFA_10934 [Cavenderia fasciculata]|uniref:FAD-binding domain-containing protein n=1 Tax=Cavenderia fasciculata TaxID=261658 RepID=F4QBT8_CACFS|nr:uncharacterized protein DFA_10934 [Cavenderia fasciculata]EGG14676.1 hypothetical protein DFA_10934 [Cavenderia fasciculata]|eukprot:XP_004351184.1 hypothetical protein DFA_10934 [Cavenderia fasciculata]
MSTTTTTSIEKPIIIIGAGIAGLSLAQGLLAAGIPFRVFERDLSPDYRSQGYRLRINHFGATALKKLLNNDMWKLFEETCADTRLGMKLVNAADGVTLSSRDGDPANKIIPAGETPLGPYTADRQTLRRFLLLGLDNKSSVCSTSSSSSSSSSLSTNTNEMNHHHHQSVGYVEFNKKLDHYEINSDSGIVTAYFTDGTIVEGSFIVGADGVRSVVRKQQYPTLEIVDTTGRCVFGKTLITDKLLSTFPADALQGISAVKAEGGPTLFLESVRWSKDIQDVSGGRIPKVDDYVYWVLCAVKSVFGVSDEEFSRMSSQQAVDLTLKLTESWDEGVRSLFKLQSPENTSALSLVSTSPSMKEWEPSSHVTFLGDAIHPMPPAGGSGANCALRDAANLFDVITQGITKERVQDYESKMRVYGGEAIVGSFNGGKMLFNLPPYPTTTTPNTN